MSDDPIDFSPSADEEHGRILRAKTGAAQSAWELGARLLHFRETGEWKNVSIGGPYANFAEYLIKGCKISVTTGYRYMAAAWFPRTAALKYGMDALALLRAIIDMTADEESVEQALALDLPTPEGGRKPFETMTLRELEQALKLVRAEEGAVAPAGRPYHKVSSDAERVRNAVRDAAAQWMKPAQISVRQVGGHDVMDLKAIPLEKLAEVLLAVASAVRK